MSQMRGGKALVVLGGCVCDGKNQEPTRRPHLACWMYKKGPPLALSSGCNHPQLGYKDPILGYKSLNYSYKQESKGPPPCRNTDHVSDYPDAEVQGCVTQVCIAVGQP